VGCWASTPIADMGYALAAWFTDSEGNLLGIGQIKAEGA
jgi:hypothetical protein